MGTIYKSDIADGLVQLCQYIQNGNVIYPIYYNYNLLEITKDQATIELQKKVTAFVAPVLE